MLQRVLVILCFFAAGMAQTTYYIPQFGAGGEGPRFETAVTFVNLSATALPASATIATFDDAGNPVELLELPPSPLDPEGGVTDEVTIEIDPAGVAVVNAGIADPTQLLTGYARVTTPSDIGVEVTFSILSGPGGTLQSRTSILPRPVSQGATLVVNVNDSADAASRVLTNTAIVHAGTEVAEVTIAVLDEFGDPVADPVVVNAQPGQRVVGSIVELFPALQGAVGFVGSANISTNPSQSIAVLALQQADLQLTTQEAFAPRQP